MDEQRQDDKLEPTYNSYVPIQNVALKSYRKGWKIEKGGERESQGDPRGWRDMMMMIILENS